MRARFLSVSAVVAPVVLAMSSGTFATHIDAPLGTFRNKMPNEGYLEFQPAAAPSFVYGEEWTGWVDVRHPVNDGSLTSLFTPYDRSDHTVSVRTTTLTDNSVPAQTASPQRPRDFDLASKIYAQAGISVVGHSHRNYTSGTNPPNANFNFPLSHGRGTQMGQPDEELAIRNGLENVLPATPNTVVENYYAKDLVSGSNAETYSPRFDGKPGMFLADQAVSSTFGHELGHMLLNGDATEDNNDDTNFMFKTGSNYTLTDVSRTKGKMYDSQIDRLYLNGGDNPRNYVQKPDGDHMNGNRVDWDYTTDHQRLESRANGADNHAGGDKMTWRINAGGLPDTNHTGHDHTGLAAFDATPNFGGPSFRYADIFSLTLRYSDFEDGAGGVNGLYTREGALDYDVEFVDASGNVAPGIPVIIFEFGWTETTLVDNWLARWFAPFDAVGVNIWADTAHGHDGITQIDAVIVSTVPEPASIGLIALCAASMRSGRRLHRRRAGFALHGSKSRANLH